MMTPSVLVRAVGTLTQVSVIDSDIMSIGEKTYEYEASPAVAYDIDVGGSDTITAASSVSCINKDGTGSATTYYETGTLENESAVATAAAGVITLTAKLPGIQGNGVYLFSTDTTITANGTTLGATTAGVGLLEDALISLLDEVQLNSEAIQMIAHLTSRSSD
jgi:hypothetical protein